MDLYLKLINSLGGIEQKVVATKRSNTQMRHLALQQKVEEVEIEPEGTEYAKEYELKEFAKYEESANNALNQMRPMSLVSGMTSMELHDDADYEPRNHSETVHRIYNNYVFLKPTRDVLPIHDKKQDILYNLSITDVIIIQGDTGCGKTTQVPQFILDDHKEQNMYCNIVVTQPRKLAAISVAKHVCEERGWDVGTIVGYQVGLDCKTGPDTVLTYMTAGVLLQKIILRKNLHEYTHIIIDEVHERTQEMDFLLIILRRFMHTNSMGVKIILMSATFDTRRFADYFKYIYNNLDIPATRIDINKQYLFEKSIHYIDELKALGNIYQDYDNDEPKIPKNIYEIFVKLVLALKQIDAVDQPIGHVLVFLPGIHEIEVAYNILMEESNKGRGNFMIVPLHSSIPGHEQGRVFAKPAPGVRKVILSTNIAESSITVPDIVYVIDFCMTKIMIVDTRTQYQTLRLSWASKTNCIQRGGRVGRVNSGRVYRLVTRDFYENEMSNDISPEMLRAPLERMILFSKKLDFEELPQSILALALDPPELSNIKATIKTLKEVGGLLSTCRGVFTELDGDITILGQFMWNLPIDIKLSKLICLGHMFSCLNESIIMAAGCSLPNIFSIPFQDKIPSYVNKLMWADGSCSDLIACLNLYQIYQNNKCTGIFKNIHDEKKWCAANYLSFRSMKDWEILIIELKSRLERINIKPTVGPQYVAMNDSEKTIILKTIIAGAFYPNYFSRSSDAGQVNEKEVNRVLKGLDQNSTVYFTNMIVDQPGLLYEERIREMMKKVSHDINVYFEQGSNKVFVSFNDKRKPMKVIMAGRKYVTYMPGKIHLDVYKAVRMRQLRMNTSFPVASKTDAWEMARKLNLADYAHGFYTLKANPRKIEPTVAPGLSTKFIFISVSHLVDAGHFYAQLATSACQKKLDTIFEALNNNEIPLDLIAKDDIELNGLYAAKFANDGLFYRCRVLGMVPFGDKQVRLNISYVDFGNTECILPNDLYVLPEPIESIPPQAMECALHGVQPIAMFNPLGIWPEGATDYIMGLTKDDVIGAEVYSVVNDIVKLILFAKNDKVSVNDHLIRMNLAEKYEEPYLSREDHGQRLQAINTSLGQKVVNEIRLVNTLPTCAREHVAAPEGRLCRSMVNLKGPFSPLEMKMFAMNNIANEVSIEGDSVNCVLLDSEPQDPHERMLIASSISKAQHTERVTLRNTTLMPSGRGLPAIISMIFAPKILLKATQYGNAYASVLCGLGANENGKPLYAEHDLKVVFDVEITQDDMTAINEIRYIMNRLLTNMNLDLERKYVEQHNFHRQLKDRLIQLLSRPRESIGREYVESSDSWKPNLKFTTVKPAVKYYRPDDIWYLHSGLLLHNISKDTVRLKKHLDELYSYIRRYTPMPGSIICQFCDVELVSSCHLNMHMMSPEHKESVRIALAEENPVDS